MESTLFSADGPWVRHSCSGETRGSHRVPRRRRYCCLDSQSPGNDRLQTVNSRRTTTHMHLFNTNIQFSGRGRPHPHPHYEWRLTGSCRPTPTASSPDPIFSRQPTLLVTFSLLSTPLLNLSVTPPARGPCPGHGRQWSPSCRAFLCRPIH